jgi:hypothetical protein
MYYVLPVHMELLLNDPGCIVPHTLLKQQVLNNSFRFNRGRDPTSCQGLNRFEACKHIHIKGVARENWLQAEVSFNSANAHDTHR